MRNGILVLFLIKIKIRRNGNIILMILKELFFLKIFIWYYFGKNRNEFGLFIVINFLGVFF